MVHGYDGARQGSCAGQQRSDRRRHQTAARDGNPPRHCEHSDGDAEREGSCARIGPVNAGFEPGNCRAEGGQVLQR
jgi:hypothetical protein